MILARRRIFFARPVSGNVFRREILTHLADITDFAGESLVWLRSGQVRATWLWATTRTVKLVTVMECRRENKGRSVAFGSVISGNSHMPGIKLALMGRRTRSTELGWWDRE